MNTYKIIGLVLTTVVPAIGAILIAIGEEKNKSIN